MDGKQHEMMSSTLFSTQRNTESITLLNFSTKNVFISPNVSEEIET